MARGWGTTHGLDEWMLTVNDTINGGVHRIVDTLERDFAVGIVPGFVRLGNPFDYRPNKVSVKFLLVRWRDTPDFSRIDDLLLYRVCTVRNRNHGLAGV